ncbi:hypothetical protein BH23BAC3_BH23BAC3_36100 [soil metagenome]
MKICFSGSINGGRQDAELYKLLIDELKRYGTVLTEHIGSDSINHAKTNRKIHDEDMVWLRESNIVICRLSILQKNQTSFLYNCILTAYQVTF